LVIGGAGIRCATHQGACIDVKRRFWKYAPALA
jgi:hypothetical protein